MIRTHFKTLPGRKFAGLKKCDLLSIQIVLALSLFLTQACARGGVHSAVSEPARRTRQVMVLEEALTKMREATSVLRAMGHFELASGDEERKTEAALVLQRPSSLRADAIDALADVWAQAGSDGSGLWLYLPSRQKIYSGSASPHNLNKLAQFDWDVEDLVAVLAGTPPAGEGTLLFQVGSGRGRYFRVGDTNLHLWTDRAGRQVLRCVRYDGSGTKIEYIIEFSDYRRTGDIEFPHRIAATFPSRRARIVVLYHDVSLGGDAQPALFLPPKRRHDKVVRFGKNGDVSPVHLVPLRK